MYQQVGKEKLSMPHFTLVGEGESVREVALRSDRLIILDSSHSPCFVAMKAESRRFGYLKPDANQTEGSSDVSLIVFTASHTVQTDHDQRRALAKAHINNLLISGSDSVSPKQPAVAGIGYISNVR